MLFLYIVLGYFVGSLLMAYSCGKYRLDSGTATLYSLFWPICLPGILCGTVYKKAYERSK